MSKDNPTTYQSVGLRQSEYDVIVSTLGRTPNETELRLFGVMWSEHCSYKSTRHLLSQFNSHGKYVIAAAGENAGLVKLNDEYALAFKIESHNHPCAVEPYQGAATGVGGIIRDILTMGAYPIAIMDGLFFGNQPTKSNKKIQTGVVRGVGNYGNCVGVPTVGGKTVYDPMYAGNPLLNAFCIGILKRDQFVSSKTAQPHQRVVILGSHTGRDGIAGAAFASTNLSEDNAAGRPNIQIGDPFAEKKLIDCVHELLENKLIACMQDMGAAGIISSTSEIALKSEVGMVLHLDRAHLRSTGMTGWEIALSESQERMLLTVEPDLLNDVKSIAEKWDVGFSVLGETTDGNTLSMYEAGVLTAELPAGLIGGNAPIIQWRDAVPDNISQRRKLPALPPENNYADTLLTMLSHPSHREKSYIWRQYDRDVQLRTISPAGAPVSIMRTSPVNGLMAMTMECDPYKCYTDPYSGAAEITAATVRSLAVCGADIMALTDCLNFASPADAGQYWEMKECIRGIADVSHVLNAPVISGNVSMYNQTDEYRIYPTPVIVGVGRIEDEGDCLPSGNAAEDCVLYLTGSRFGSLGAGLYGRVTLSGTNGQTVTFNADNELKFIAAALATARNRSAVSGRAIAGGGLLMTLAVECIQSNIGASVALPGDDTALWLFGEGGPRAIYAVRKENASSFETVWNDVGCAPLGCFQGTRLIVGDLVDISLSELKRTRQPTNPL